MSESLLDRPAAGGVVSDRKLRDEVASQTSSAEASAENTARTTRSSRDIAVMNLKTVGTILLLCGLAPLNLSVVLLASVRRIAARWTQSGLPAAFSRSAGQTASHNASAEKSLTDSEPLTILISGGKMTKAMQLARYFSRAGHRVVLCEMEKYRHTGHRFSNCVDQFYTVPKPDDLYYSDALLNIVRREKVDVYVPACSPLASLYDSLAIEKLKSECRVLHAKPETIRTVDDKFQFAQASESLGLFAPKSFLITDPQQVIDFDFSNEDRPYILKSIAYDSVRRLDLTKLPCATPEQTAAFVSDLPISESRPWVMQEFITGTEFCTHGTMVDGELRVHCCCKSSAFQVNYDHVDIVEIEDWVRTFASGMNLTGQFSLDFIQSDDDGKFYAIECNPRTHSAITVFHDHDDVAAAYLNPANVVSESTEEAQYPVVPLETSRPTYWLYHELWRMVSNITRPKRVQERMQIIARGKEAIFDWNDPWPFFMVHHVQIPLLLLGTLASQKDWVKIDFNIGKLVQLGGE